MTISFDVMVLKEAGASDELIRAIQQEADSARRPVAPQSVTARNAPAPAQPETTRVTIFGVARGLSSRGAPETVRAGAGNQRR